MNNLLKAIRSRFQDEPVCWEVWDKELSDLSYCIGCVPGYLNYRPGTYTKKQISLERFVEEAISHGYTDSDNDVMCLIENGI